MPFGPLALALVMTLACSLLGGVLAGLPYLSVLGALVVALMLGMGCQAWRQGVEYAMPGIALISNKFLRAGIILLGFRLNLAALAQAGVRTILLACVIVAATISLVYALARRLGVDRHLAILTASGTGICGAAAVMGISSQLPSADRDRARHVEDSVVAVAIVAILGTLFTILEIVLRPLLGMTPVQFGVMAGGSLHEIAHAVAAGGAGGAACLDSAIVMKLSRVLLLAPAAVVIGLWYRRREGVAAQAGARVPVPWFMLGFVVASVVGTFAPLDAALLAGLVRLSSLVLGMAMAALGMSVNFRILLTRGRNAFLAALAVSVLLAAFACVAAKALFA
ncbi:putative sulfate exporter family transporter [bacterium]|nr:putative sulfate exporter family transporter [bacterium]